VANHHFVGEGRFINAGDVWPRDRDRDRLQHREALFPRSDPIARSGDTGRKYWVVGVMEKQGRRSSSRPTRMSICRSPPLTRTILDQERESAVNIATVLAGRSGSIDHREGIAVLRARRMSITSRTTRNRGPRQA